MEVDLYIEYFTQKAFTLENKTQASENNFSTWQYDSVSFSNVW